MELEEASRVGARQEPDRRRVHPSSACNAGRSEGDPGRFVSFPAVRDRGQVGGIGLDQYPVVGNCADDVIPSPVPEGDDTAEGDVPTSVQGDSRQVDATCVAVQHTDHVLPARLAHHGDSVLICIPRVHDDGARMSFREFELHRERAPLLITGRIIVVIIEAALSDSYRPGVEETFECWQILMRIECRSVMRMNPSRKRDKARMRFRNPGRATRLLDGRTDADYSMGARIAGAGDYGLAVAVEGLVRKVGVAVEEVFHTGPAFLRGYLFSIHSRTGPAI